MKFNKLYNILKKAIEFKRNKSKLKEAVVHAFFFENKEGESVEKKKSNLPASQNKSVEKKKSNLPASQKKALLKKIYTEILINTPYKNNIPVFHDLIDQAPESYIDYELKINLKKALAMVDELISGTGDFTDDELTNLVNVVSGIGFPAIEKHATGVAKMSKKSQKFGSEGVNKNVGEFLQSLKQRREKLALPSRTMGKEPVIISKALTRKDKLAIRERISNRLKKIFRYPNVQATEFGILASKLKIKKGMNMDRIVDSITSSIINSKSLEEAKKKSKETLNLNFSKGDDLFNSMFNVALNKLREKQKEHVKKKPKKEKDAKKT